ncbi:WD40-repeat-containing domain protein [Dunaliella salina]|uniref:WD40-repeat-containing domain protein n=1 Tax=Dunaliella salina TaxID=3046 RepID=A0ABQ7GSA7_DUNSA|nr:WD40-repeat-containing domain protein [Dunaliella salina]|eukprot:KAF5837496.1 WD40-repeat-containing domain protein [Dunaliella salina]
MDEEKQILVKFVTKLPVELKVSEAPVAVPTTLKRYGLSQIINHLLGLEPARPFDFVIYGELVRKSLEAHLTEHQLSAESLLEVEYVPAVTPPKHKQSAPHDDWVSAVDGTWVQEAVSGSYDGCARLWSLSSRDGSGEEASCSSSWKAHASGINALACSTTSAGHRLVVSAGKDRAVLLWQLPSSSGASPDLVASYKGHTDSVEALAISPDGRHLASSGWDGSLRMWRMGQQVLEEAAAAAAAGGGADGEGAKASSKKRKVSAPSTVAPEGGLREECVSQLHGHIHCISSLAFATDKVMFSGGWDHSVRRWDVATGINTDTYNGSKAVYTVACPEKGTPQPSAPGKVIRLRSAGSGCTMGCTSCS